MFTDPQVLTQEHSAPSHALTNALGDATSVQGAWDSLHFPRAALDGSMDPVSMI